MRKGAYNEDVALQPRPAREFANKLFFCILLRKNIIKVLANIRNLVIYYDCCKKITYMVISAGADFSLRSENGGRE